MEIACLRRHILMLAGLCKTKNEEYRADVEMLSKHQRQTRHVYVSLQNSSFKQAHSNTIVHIKVSPVSSKTARNATLPLNNQTLWIFHLHPQTARKIEHCLPLGSRGWSSGLKLHHAFGALLVQNAVAAFPALDYIPRLDSHLSATAATGVWYASDGTHVLALA